MFDIKDFIHHGDYREQIKKVYQEVNAEFKSRRDERVNRHGIARKENRKKHFLDISKTRKLNGDKVRQLQEEYSESKGADFLNAKELLFKKLDKDLDKLRHNYHQEELRRSSEFSKNNEVINLEFQEMYKELIEEYNNTRSSEMHLQGNLSRARTVGLPATLTHSIKALSLLQGGKCLISGKRITEIEYALEHLIPLSWKVSGGTTFENCYLIERSLNSSKNNRNPIEFAESLPSEERFNFFEKLIPMMAIRNHMTNEEYISYIEQSYETRK